MNYSHLLPVREFPDRGTKWLLESPENVRELLRIIAADLVGKLDFSRIQQIPTTFIPDNLRKQEADLLFLIPFIEGGTEREVLLYILIEHQSTPSPSMGFRLSFYMHQIWDKQRREWIEQKLPESQWRFRPILPIVFYTGSEKWETPLAISALMDLPRELEPFVPHYEALFFNLKETAPDELTRSEHPFGWVLRVL
ncbi:Rpn family recombination-promoting nuclease/putative transposase, partial [Candidatus Poribacteria bacterium]|nr:Rpn family recombination-promoting nuclease/putative transposase [Candidatus Poribacteria bacterium]